MRHLLVGIGLWVLGLLASFAWQAAAQGPPAQPTCEEQLNQEMFQKGELFKQLAIAREQVRVVGKDRDDAKAALAKLTPKPAEKPTPEPEKK